MAVTAMAVETRPELVGKRFLCLAVGEEVRPESGDSGRCWRSWRAGVIRAVSHRDSRNPDLAVRANAPESPSLRLHSHPRLAAAPSGVISGTWLSLANWRSRPSSVLTAVLPISPARVAASPRVASSVGAVTERDSAVPAWAPWPLGLAAAAPAAPGRPRRSYGEAGLRARRRTDRSG